MSNDHVGHGSHGEHSIDHLPWSRRLTRTVPPVLFGAVVGGLGTKPTSRWYRSLDKPSWEPPGGVFGPVWSALYALTAGATASVLDKLPVDERADVERALWLNMGLNAGWCWLFFTAQKPRWALAEIVLLEASTVDLLRRARAAGDGRAAAALAPYVAWNAFAAALNAEIVRRNP